MILIDLIFKTGRLLGKGHGHQRNAGHTPIGGQPHAPVGRYRDVVDVVVEQPTPSLAKSPGTVIGESVIFVVHFFQFAIGHPPFGKYFRATVHQCHR